MDDSVFRRGGVGVQSKTFCLREMCWPLAVGWLALFLLDLANVGLHLVLQEIILRLHSRHVWTWLGSWLDFMIR